jgi:hypothetical protein
VTLQIKPAKISINNGHNNKLSVNPLLLALLNNQLGSIKEFNHLNHNGLNFSSHNHASTNLISALNSQPLQDLVNSNHNL